MVTLLTSQWHIRIFEKK